VVLYDIPDPRNIKLQGYEALFGNGDDGGCGSDNPYEFCVCNKCGEAGFEWSGLADRIGCDCPKVSNDERAVAAAFAKGRAARFEHDHRETYGA
jgi:hypothetical protein